MGREMSQREMSQREMSQREMGQREMGQREMGQREMGQREMSQREMGGRGMGRRDVGRLGEDAACRYLLDRGALLVDRNWRCPYGEVDIVARLANSLLFCEVRTRRGGSFGTPLESITPAKANRMSRVAQAWLAQHGSHPGPIRLDVIGLLLHDNGSVQLTHIEGVQP